MRTHTKVKEIYVLYANFHYMMYKMMFGVAEGVCVLLSLCFL
jgi:hypothetical protein